MANLEIFSPGRICDERCLSGASHTVYNGKNVF